MRIRTLGLAVLAGCGTAAPPDAEQPIGAELEAQLERPMVVVPAEAVRFEPLVASLPDGPEIAVLWGDPDTGPSAMLLRMRAGGGPLHVHGSDYHLLLLEGRMKHWAAGESEAEAAELGPGSYWYQPGGQPHGDACLAEVCVMFITWSGQRDAALADGPG